MKKLATPALLILFLMFSCNRNIIGTYCMNTPTTKELSAELSLFQDSTFSYYNYREDLQVAGTFIKTQNEIVLNSYDQPNYPNCNVRIFREQNGKTEIKIYEGFNIPVLDKNDNILTYIMFSEFYEIPDSHEVIKLVIDKIQNKTCKINLAQYRNKRIEIELLHQGLFGESKSKYFQNKVLTIEGRNKLKDQYYSIPFIKCKD